MIKISHRKMLLCVSASAGALLGFPVSAQAQGFAGDPAFSDDASGGEIVVTARRREESLQDVPIAVTAISSDALDLSGAQDITAISQSTPSVTLENSRATGSTLSAFIRGVGQQDPVAGFEQGVGIYLDDVYFNRPQGALLDIYDVERIEILRGPQGTLYGRNTIGGAVKYVTRRIRADKATFRAKLAYGSYNQMDAVASVTAPVSDTLRVGATVATLSRDGFGTNLTTGKDNYDKAVFGARGTVEWEPADGLLFRLSGDYTHDTSQPRHGYRMLPGLTQPKLLKGKYDTTAGITRRGPYSENDVEAWGSQMSVDWTVAPDWRIRSITAYREDDTRSPVDVDSTPLNSFDIPIVYTNWQFSQELQLLYEGDSLALVAGVYYLDANALTAFDSVFQVVTQFTMGDVDTKAWAVFGEATWDMTDSLSLTLGGRYTRDKRTSHVQREFFLGDSSPYFGGTGASITLPVVVDGVEVVPTFNGTRTDSAFTPRAILAWKPVEEVNFYGSYSRGFKGGGFDPRGDFGNPDVRQGFRPEFVDSYEVGAKTSFLNGRVTANTAFFYADYTDVQIPGSVVVEGPPVAFVGTLTNAGKARIYGVEFEGAAQLSDSLRANISFAHNNAAYTRFIVNNVNVARDRDVQNTPAWMGSGGLTYSVPIGSGRFSLTGSASYRGKTQQFEVAMPLIDQKGYWLFDAGAQWVADSDRVRIGLYGRNLSDKRYITSGYYFPGAATDNSVTAYYGNPRTVTASVEFRF
ncbi:MAG: TonB-dependent receptor [Alphaproteobacteria bacterium HGW-Alphaproteobacteria-13]|nr:MAG: TonB-dependent receptor [Alphaproteobacteria bacterium HGW-Alphaproteobacteria-13]